MLEQFVHTEYFLTRFIGEMFPELVLKKDKMVKPKIVEHITIDGYAISVGLDLIDRRLRVGDRILYVSKGMSYERILRNFSQKKAVKVHEITIRY